MAAENPTTDAPVLLSVEGIVKDFPGLRALDDVSLQVRSGQIVALLGQNGSGKSTLVKVLAGVYTADAGTVTVHRTETGTAKQALHFIHQDLGLIENLSTVENLNLTSGTGRVFRPVPRRVEYRRAQNLLRRFGIDIDVRRPISHLTPAQRAIVAIARAMDGWTSPVNVLILDEPTAALHGEEVEVLFDVIRTVAAEGAGVMFISHRLEEVTELADRVIVLRDGRLTADMATTGLTSGRLAELITGRDGGAAEALAPAAPPGTGPAALTVQGLTGARVRGLDVELRRGEIVGITGNLGSGREHIAGLIYGAVPRVAGTVTVGSTVLTKASPHESLRHGMALVPADRRGHGGVMTLSVRENLTLPELAPLCVARVHLRPKAEKADVGHWMRQVEVHPSMPERALGLFSGGNQQKTVIARWLRTNPTVLLVEEPTQGVDVGSSEAIRALIVAAAARGTAVLVASSDNADLIRMCTRVLVLRDGECVAVLTGDAINDHRLTQECLGVNADHLTRTTAADLENAHA